MRWQKHTRSQLKTLLSNSKMPFILFIVVFYCVWSLLSLQNVNVGKVILAGFNPWGGRTSGGSRIFEMRCASQMGRVHHSSDQSLRWKMTRKKKRKKNRPYLESDVVALSPLDLPMSANKKPPAQCGLCNMFPGVRLLSCFCQLCQSLAYF